MKFRNLLLLAASGAVLLAACTEEDKKPDYSPAVISSFGFYEEQNPSLTEDYIIDEISGNSLTFNLSYGTDEATVKALIPTFETTADAVYLSDASGDVGSVVESGKTAVDFSSDVVLIAKSGNNYNAYTVSVKVAQASKWVEFAKTTASMAERPAAGINPVDGKLYIAGIDDRDELKRPVMYSFDGTNLSELGFLSDTTGAAVAVGFSTEGSTFVSFQDKVLNPDTDKTENKTSVVKVSKDGSYSFVGSRAAINRQNTSQFLPSGVAALSDNDIWTATTLFSNGSTFKKRALNLSHFDGSGWTNEIAIDGRDATSRGYNPTMKIIDGVPYLGVFNQNANTLSLYKLENGNWKTVIESLSIKKMDTEESSKLYLSSGDFDIDSKGIPYFFIGAEFLGEGVYNGAVVKVNVSDKGYEYIPIGGVLKDLTLDSNSYPRFALSAGDVPYVVFDKVTGDKSHQLCITHIDSKTKTWTDPEKLGSFDSWELTLDFDKNGKGYIVAREQAGPYHLFYTQD